MKYQGYYRVNGWASYNKEPIESDNLEKLIKHVRKLAESNRPAGGKSHWHVHSGDILLAEGYTLEDGTRIRII